MPESLQHIIFGDKQGPIRTPGVAVPLMAALVGCGLFLGVSCNNAPPTAGSNCTVPSVAAGNGQGGKIGEAASLLTAGGQLLDRGDYAKAEEMYQKSIAIGEELGHKTADSQYGGLGDVSQARGELGKAEETYRKSLANEEELNRKQGMAIAYGNLGLVYKSRGEFDRAEEMYRKSLALFQEIGAASQVEYVQGLLASLPAPAGQAN